MPLLKFIGYTGTVFLVGSILIALLLTPFVLLIGWGGSKNVDVVTKRFHWSTIAVKCLELWFFSTMIILGAAFYSNGNTGYYWLSIIIGSTLLIFFKVDSIRNAERAVLEKAERQWENIDFARADVKAGPMPRLWRHELAANTVAFFYIYIAALFDSLTAIPWLQASVLGATNFLKAHTLVSVGFYLIGWFAVSKYMFAICLGLGTLPFLLRKPEAIKTSVTSIPVSVVSKSAPEPIGKESNVASERISLRDRLILESASAARAKHSELEPEKTFVTDGVVVEASQSLQNKKSPKIVIVNDETFVLKSLEIIIPHCIKNSKILLFENSVEAWQELSQTDPDLLIIDDKMNGATRTEAA